MNIKEKYADTICKLYYFLINCGEIFTASMERNLQEVEREAEMSRRRNVLKRRV